jgi:hypothetical protein
MYLILINKLAKPLVLTRSADKNYMTRRTTDAEAPWVEWIDRDDRALLGRLEDMNWSPDESLLALSPHLQLIVASLGKASQLSLGWCDDQNLYLTQSKDFLVWLQNNGDERRHLSDTFASLKRGPWTLPVLLSRSYVRHRSGLHVQKFDDESVEVRDLSQLIASDLVRIVDDWQDELPSGIKKTCLMLYFEGLVPAEIAGLLCLKPEVVESFVGEMKLRFFEQDKGRKFGT